MSTSIARTGDSRPRWIAWLRDLVTALVRRPEATAPPSPAALAVVRQARLAAEREYGFQFSARRIGCLLVHGLTSTPQSMRRLGEAFAARGIDVEAVLLPGHGTTPEDLESTTWEEWYEAVRAALNRMRPHYDVLFVCGQSMGGALALRAAAEEPVDGVISLAGFLYLRDWRAKLIPLVKHVWRWRKSIGNDIADPDTRDEVCYERMSLRTIEQLMHLGHATKAILPKIAVPALVVQSRVDHVVPPDTADFIYDHIESHDKELVRLEHSFHVVSMDYDADLVADRAVRFMRRVGYAESTHRPR